MSAAALDVRCAPACVQEPPGRAGSYGDDVAEIAERIGRPLVPEQLDAVDVLVAHDARGRFLSVEAGLEGPRQTVGKSGGIMLPIALWTALTDPDQITWTAHLAETSLKQFADLCGEDPDDEAGLIKSCDWLRRRVRKPTYENGSEGVSFLNHAHIAFKVRSPGRGRGMSGNTVIDDEFLFMTAEQVGAQAPVLATRSLHGNARAYRASSAAGARGNMLRALRRRALAADPTLTYVGWWAAGGWEDPGCASEMCSHELGSVGCALDDEALLRTCNPLVDRLVSIDFLRSMRAGMTPLEFGREFLGWQEPGDEDERPIDPVKWAALAVEGHVDGNPSFFLDCSPGLSSASIAGATLRHGRPHVKLADYRPGTHWVQSKVRELREKYPDARWQYEGTGPASALVEQLRAAGVVVDKPFTGTDVARGCAHLQNLVRGGALSHSGDQAVTVALASAVKRDIGDPGLWSWRRRRSAGDISPLVAVTGALWLLESAHVSVPVFAFS